MNTTIRFPNLGLEFNPGRYIELPFIDIAYYGILVTCGMLAGCAIAYAEAKRTKQNTDDYWDIFTYIMISAIVGARLYYVIFEWEYYSQNLLEIFNIRNGGLAVYGGIIACAITLFFYTRKKKLSLSLIADTFALGLVMGQIIGRWGNFFNREAFGGYTENLFAMQIPVSEANGVTYELLEKAIEINGEFFIQVHPTFLYESLWNLMLFIFLLLYRNHKKFDGEVFSLYLVGYGIGRAIIEGLRTDQLTIGNTGIAASQLLSIILVIAATFFIIYNRKKAAKKGLTTA